MKNRDISSVENFWEIPFSGVKCVNEDFSNRIFERCVFEGCDFHESRFTGSKFLNCTFNDCNLSVTRFDESVMKGVQFSNSKLTGVVFSPAGDSEMFSVYYDRCVIYSSNFLGLCLENTSFNQCEIIDTDFINIDLKGSFFKGTNLKGSRFQNANLSRVDFSTATNYSINPLVNNIREARFAGTEAFGLLNSFGIRLQI